ncbi:hypothetical protein [Dactylosporangium sp. NPDC051541]|uniref:hypothetical protein n=1 Tax=Dactylosporangium sp. NPDC051541 TaxID=3363977 RepID=UPI00379D10B2
MTDAMDALRDDLRGLEGAARTRPLMELGRLLADDYWRKGPGSPAALPSLHEAVDVLDEAYQYLDPADVLRGNVAGMLGGLYAVRHVAHAGAVQDRERGIFLLEETLSFPTLPAVLHNFSRVYLGQLYMRRAMDSMQGEAVMQAMLTGRPPATAADADRAVACFRAILDAPVRNAELIKVAEAMLTAAEAVQTLMGGFGGGPGGFDLGRMMAAVERMQGLQQQAAGAGGVPFMPSVPNIFDADDLARRDPLDRPTTVMTGAVPAPEFVPKPRPAPVAVDVDGARRDLAARLDRAGGARAALDSAGPPDLDDLVALATTVVHGGGTGADRVRLALVLHLRAVAAEDDEWGGAAQDTEAAAEALAAAGAVPDGDVELALELAARLGRPQLAAGAVAPVAAALRTIGAGALVLPLGGRVLVVDAATGGVAAAPAELPERIVVVGDDAAGWGGDRVVSTVASLAQLVRLAARAPRPVTGDAVFVADPRGERGGLEWASVETMLLRRLLYPRSIGLGHTVEYVDGPGTADEVRAHLGASMLFLGCGIAPPGVLRLAGPTELDLTTLTGAPSGGLAILPPLEGFPAVADALLAAGFTGVVGWRRPVPAPVATALLFLLHLRLVDDGLAPAEAVRAVRAHVCAADPKPVPGLPDHHAATLAAGDASEYLDDFEYRGI